MPRSLRVGLEPVTSAAFADRPLAQSIVGARQGAALGAPAPQCGAGRAPPSPVTSAALEGVHGCSTSCLLLSLEGILQDGKVGD